MRFVNPVEMFSRFTPASLRVGENVTPEIAERLVIWMRVSPPPGKLGRSPMKFVG
jgi:hypothetical protein